MEPLSDEELLKAFVAGDAAAFELLVRRHTAAVYQFVVRFMRNAALTEDIVQETFLQVSQSAATFDPARRFRPWLFTIAANKSRDVLRARQRRREVPEYGGEDIETQPNRLQAYLRSATTSPQGELESDEKRRAVRKIVEAMPRPLWEVLVLAYYHQFRYRQIADILGIPLGTVKSRLHAAVAFLGTEYRLLHRDNVPSAGGEEDQALDAKTGKAD